MAYGRSCSRMSFPATWTPVRLNCGRPRPKRRPVHEGGERARNLEDGPQSRAGSGAGDRSGGVVGLAADGARRREGGRPGGGRCDAPGAQQPVDRRHRRDRRGRARRGADALYRREGRHRAGPADRHRARPARRHDDHRQGRRQRARGHGDGRPRRLSQRARRLHGQDRGRRRPARRGRRSRRDAGRPT